MIATPCPAATEVSIAVVTTKFDLVNRMVQDVVPCRCFRGREFQKPTG